MTYEQKMLEEIAKQLKRIADILEVKKPKGLTIEEAREYISTARIYNLTNEGKNE